MNAHDWLTQARKLDSAVLDHMGVKGADHPSMGSSVAFPYRRGGEAYAGKWRAINGKEWRSSQGVTRGLYNADALSTDEGLPIVVTEGEIDCITVIQSGHVRAVSLPDGWTEQGNKIEALVEVETQLRASPFVIVAGDNDTAGESLPRAVANLLKGHDVRYATWPDGCKDANDVLRLFGEGEVSARLNAAKRIDPPGGFITALSDLPPLSARRVLRAGIREIDWRVALELGAMSVVTGVPGHGKSTFTTWLAHRIARNERVRVAFLSLETHPHRTRDHLTRLEVGRPFDGLSKDVADDVLAALDHSFRIVHRTYDGPSPHNLGWLERMVWTLAVRDHCKLIVIDPWNELEHLPEPGESLTNYINFALQQIRQWAEKLEVHIQVVAHPKKLSADFTPRAPQGYDVADSAAFANKPSLGLTVHNSTREDGAKVTELWTWKVRDTQLYRAEKGKTEIVFDKEMMSYAPLAAE